MAKTATRTKNAADLTLRNLQAERRRNRLMTTTIKMLAAAIDELAQRVTALEAKGTRR